MAVALAWPEPEKRGRGNKKSSKNEDFNIASGYISQARFVLRHCLDKAEALASYARQSKDDTLRKMAERIQARAIRRCGELLKEQEATNRRDRDRWIAQARASFVPTERQPCVVCGRFQSIAQAHHLFPLAIQWRFGVQHPIHDHEWLCPNHHVSIHILIAQSQSSSLDASEACINVTSDLALNMSELTKVLSLLEKFHSYPKG